MADQNTNAEQIGKYLSGEASPAEVAELMAWVEQSQANKEFFDNMLQLWAIPEPQPAMPPLNASKAWAALESAIDQRAPAPKNRGIISMKMMLRVAAVLLPLALALWWTLGRNDAPTEVLMAQTIAQERKTIILPDGSTVQLNENSALHYRQDADARYVTLSGEAFFEVQHLDGKPFIIESGEARTTVLGTSFNVRAYPNEERVEVSVSTGKVQVEAIAAPQQKAMLAAGEAVAVRKKDLRLAAAEEIANNATAWKNRQFRFDDTPVDEVVMTLERYFGLKIELSQPAIGACRFSGHYDNPQLEEVLEALSFAIDAQWEQRAEVISLSGNGCR